MFTGDQVTLIAKWRDYQYIIKYNVKYSDKSTTTGTMADQTRALRPGCDPDPFAASAGRAMSSPAGLRAPTTPR